MRHQGAAGSLDKGASPDPAEFHGRARALRALIGPHHAQLGIVVDDIWSALATHMADGPWAVYHYDGTTMPGLQMHGSSESFAFTLAYNQSTPQLEFIQPLDSHSPYAEWLVEHGPSMHHLGFVVEDAVAVTAEAVQLGYSVIMSGASFGADGTGAYSYLDTQDDFGYLVEVIQPSRARRPPARVVRELADIPWGAGAGCPSRSK